MVHHATITDVNTSSTKSISLISEVFNSKLTVLVDTSLLFSLLSVASHQERVFCGRVGACALVVDTRQVGLALLPIRSGLGYVTRLTELVCQPIT